MLYFGALWIFGSFFLSSVEKIDLLVQWGYELYNSKQSPRMNTILLCLLNVCSSQNLALVLQAWNKLLQI